MKSDHAPCHTLVIGDWCVEPTAGRIVRAGLERRLRPQVMDLLVWLSRRPGEVSSKAELLDAVWGTRFVSESALSTAIAELRDALEDDAKEPRFIQTVPKRGYRMVSTVDAVAAAEAPTSPARDAAPATPPPLDAALATSLDAPARAARAVAAPVAIEPVAKEPADVGPADFGAAALERSAIVTATALDTPTPIAAAMPIGTVSARRLPLWPLAAALVLLMAFLVSGASWRRSQTMAPPIEVPISRTPGVEPARTIQMTAIAPDGRTLVYAVDSSAGLPLMRRDLDTREVVPIGGTDGAALPFFSPDGAWIGFWQDGMFRRLPTRGDAADHSEPLVSAPVPFGAAWRSNGDLVYSATNHAGLLIRPAGGQAAYGLTDPRPANGEVSLRWPEALPDSRFVLFAVHRSPAAQIQAIDITTGARHVVVEGGTLARFAAPDRLVFSRGRTLLAAPFDPRSARTAGRAVELARGLSYHPRSHLAQFSVSATGVLAYLTEPTRIDRELVLVDRAGRVTPLGAPARPYIHPRLSPDGTRIALWLEADATPDTAEVWTYDLSTKQLTQRTAGGVSWRPVWSPDGQRLAYDARPSETVNVFLLGLSPGATPQPLLRRDRPQMAEDWLPDGQTLVMSQVEPDTGRDLHLVNVATRETRPLAKERDEEGAGAASPNGRWVAYVRGDFNASAVYAVPVQGDHPARVRLAARGREPRWSRDGRELFFRDRGAMYSLPIAETDGTLSAGPPVELFRGEFDERPLPRANYDVMPDGRFLMLRRTDAHPSQAIILSLNWRDRPDKNVSVTASR